MQSAIFENARILDGSSDEGEHDRFVRVADGLIKEISDKPIKDSSAHRIDLLLLDYQLSEPINGLEFYRALQKESREVPAILVTGVTFAIPQFVISNFINPWIVDIGASLISMGCLILFLRVWQPRQLFSMWRAV